MWEWLASPIDPARAHAIGQAVAWHGRMMVLAWAILAPLAVLIARFFKIMPRQNWPQELDNPFWWRCHWIGQSLVLILSLGGSALVMSRGTELSASPHVRLGQALLIGMIAQVLLGLLRGSKGGPTALAPDGSPRGHHYDMTPWRRMFELVHKTLGYALLALALVTICYGLWAANAPRWMWIFLLMWWGGLLGLGFYLQSRGRAVDTYQAIWGDDPTHPGNRRPPPGWGMRRPGQSNERKRDVRDDRRNRVRSP